MSCTQHIPSSDPMSASGFSPTSTSLQQTGGESESSSVMGYVLPHQKSGATSVGFGPQHGYMLYPEKRQPTTFIGFNQDQPCLQQSAYCDTQSDVAWGHIPLQKGWNTPTHHHAEQSNVTAPFLSSVYRSLANAQFLHRNWYWPSLVLLPSELLLSKSGHRLLFRSLCLLCREFIMSVSQFCNAYNSVPWQRNAGILQSLPA